jgi:hypothetical protein
MTLKQILIAPTSPDTILLFRPLEKSAQDSAFAPQGSTVGG